LQLDSGARVRHADFFRPKRPYLPASTKRPILWIAEALLLGLQWPGREANLSPPSRPKAMNVPTLPRMCAGHCYYLYCIFISISCYTVCDDAGSNLIN